MSRHGRQSGFSVTGTHETAKLFPLWGNGAPLYIWAENGLICVEDARTNGYKTMSWKDAALRTLGLSQMAINSSEDRRWSQERADLQRFVIAMQRVIQKARAQGAPDDNGESLESVVRERKQCVAPRRPHVIVGDIF